MAERPLALRDEAGQLHVVTRRADGRLTIGETEVAIAIASDRSLVIAGDEQQHLAWTAVSDDVCWVFVAGRVFTFELDQPARRKRVRAADHGPIEAPMPATVRRVAVRPGDEVRRGDVLLVLEAMKMELPLRAAGDGRVEAVSCREGDQVQAGQELVRIDWPP